MKMIIYSIYAVSQYGQHRIAQWAATSAEQAKKEFVEMTGIPADRIEVKE